MAGRERDKRSLYEEVVRAEYIERKCREATRVNIVEGYMGVLRKRKRHARVQCVRRVSAVAAGILIPLLAIMIWFGQKEEIPSVQVAEVIRHGEVKAELIFSDVISLTPVIFWCMVALLMFLSTFFAIVIFANAKLFHSGILTEIIVIYSVLIVLTFIAFFFINKTLSNY